MFFSTDGDMIVPNKTQDNTFVYIESNGTVYDVIKKTGPDVKDYSTARQVCQQKGGDLVTFNTKKLARITTENNFMCCANDLPILPN